MIPKLNPWSLGEAATFFDAVKQAATETEAGVVELATNAEAVVGTDTGRAVTPAGLKAHTDALSAYPPPRVQNKTTGTSLDLADTEVVAFSYASPTTISTFSNVEANKLYVFTNVGASAITIDRTAAHLNGSTNQVLNTNDVLLMMGRTATAMKQAAPMADNG